MLVGDAGAGQDATACGIDHLVKALWSAVECGNRREDGAALLSGLSHQAEVSQVQRRFAYHQEDVAPFLELHVCGAR